MKLRYLVIVAFVLLTGLVSHLKAEVPGPKVIRKQLLVAHEKKSLNDYLIKVQ
jgi:hypothetical protein